jgi:outer membrane protein, adhesin transport system
MRTSKRTLVWLLIGVMSLSERLLAEDAPVLEAQEPAKNEKSQPFEPFRARISRALEAHPEIRQAMSVWREQEYAGDEIAAAGLPQVKVGLEGRSDLLSANREAYDRGDRVDAVVTISQQIYDFGALGARKDATVAESASAYWALQATQESVLFKLVDAYYAVNRYRNLIGAATLNREAHNALEQRVRSRVEAGAGSSADLLKAESQAVTAYATLVGFQGQLEEARNRYMELFDDAPGQLPLPSASAVLPLVREGAALEDWRDHPEYQSVFESLEASRLHIEGVEKGALPALSLNLQGRRFDVNRPERAENDLALIVSVDYDLYSGGADRARAQQARAASARSQAELTQVMGEIRRESAIAWSAMDISQRQLDVAVANVTSNEKVINAFRKQFEVGTRRLNDLLDAQEDLFQSRRNEINARFDRDVARFRYLRSVGQLRTLFSITSNQPRGL